LCPTSFARLHPGGKFTSRTLYGQAQPGIVREKELEIRIKKASFHDMPGLTFEIFKPLLATPESPALGPGPRGGHRTTARLNDSLDKIFEGMENREFEAGRLIRSLVLLWHDHLDAAHGIAQEIENSDGSVVHGIVHRREPDYSNAVYWFRRAGNHPSFPEISRRVGVFLDSRREAGELRVRLIPKGAWDPLAFIEVCEMTSGKMGFKKQEEVLREIQRVELETLLEHWLNGGAFAGR
jgi:hypothetical protein